MRAAVLALDVLDRQAELCVSGHVAAGRGIGGGVRAARGLSEDDRMADLLAQTVLAAEREELGA